MSLTVVVLTTSEAATTGVLPVLAYATVTGRDMATAFRVLEDFCSRWEMREWTYCFLVFEARVGIVLLCRGVLATLSSL